MRIFYKKTWVKPYLIALILLAIGSNWASPIKVCFTPQQNCTKVIINAIDNAQKAVYVQAYSFTSPKIASALVRAKQRGVKVRVLLDKSHYKDSKSSQKIVLLAAGIDLKIDKVSGIAHNKIMIIDHCRVITGSFNFTNAAQLRNAENVIIIDDSQVAQSYEQNWHLRHKKAIPVTFYKK